MPNDQLLSYISTSRASGLDDASITQALLAAGWQPDQVTEAINLQSSVQPSVGLETNTVATSTTTSNVSSATSSPSAVDTGTTLQTITATTVETTSSVASTATTPISKSLKIAALLIWANALIYLGYGILWTIVLFILALALRKAGSTLFELEVLQFTNQQPFLMAAIAVMLLWLGRGVWVGTRKLMTLCLLVLIGGVAVWLGSQWFVSSELTKFAGEQITFGGFLFNATGSMIQQVMHPIMLSAVPAIFALVLALPKADPESNSISLKSKIILGIFSVLFLAPALTFTTMLAVWSTDAASGFDQVALKAGFPIHRLPLKSEFKMATHWAEPSSVLQSEPSPAVQAAAIIKTDLSASVSAHKIIIIRQYPKSNNVTPTLALNFDPKNQAQEVRQLKLENGLAAAVSERPFGQGKIIKLAFETEDGVLITLSSIKAQLPEVLKLANELSLPQSKK